VSANVDPRSLGFLRLQRSAGETGTALGAVRHLLSRHVDVVYADVDLVAVGDVNEATTDLNEPASSPRAWSCAINRELLGLSD
jgi:hypothetical protein